MNSIRVFRIDGSVYFMPITFSKQEDFDSTWRQVELHLGGMFSMYAVRLLDCDGEIVRTVPITAHGFEILHRKFALCMESDADQSPRRDEAAEVRAMVELHEHWLRKEGRWTTVGK
jgi:hypothetical protein